MKRDPLVSKKAHHIITIVLLVLGIGALAYFKMLWPEILAVVGLVLAIKQFLRGHIFDPIATLIIFIATYAMVKWHMAWEILIPLPAIIGVLGIFIIIYEYVLRKDSCDDGGHGSDDF